MPTSEGGYKQFKIGDLFDCKGTKSLDEGKLAFVEKNGVNFVTRKSDNYGISGQIPVQAFEPNAANTITSNVVGRKMVRYQERPYYCSQNINKLTARFELNRERAFYIMAHIQKFVSSLGKDYDGYKLEELTEHYISLPIDASGEIDFKFMESYVQYIEEEHINELDEYLNAAGLSDCTLTKDEENALKTNIENITLHPFKMEKLFYKPNLSFRKKKFNKKEDVSTIRNSEYSIPLVNAKHGNNGIMYYGREQDYDTVEMAIDIVNDGAVATGDVYPQPQKTGVLYNAYLIKLLEDVATESILMYYAATIQKNIKLLFSYQNKAGWEKVKDCSIFLPVTSDGSINYEFMENYITALKKQTIARVKVYIEQEHSIVVEEAQIEQTIIPLVYPEYKPGFIPLYTLRAACGYFDEGQLPEEEGWVDASGLGFTPDPKRHFVVHAKGDSMLPKIKDGDLCVFEWYKAGSRNGEIVLTQSSEYDSEYGGRYTIKRYQSEKTVTDEGWQHASVQLLPLNKDYEPIELDEFGEYRTIGIFKCTLK